MPRPPKAEPVWYQRVAEIMVREGRTIRHAADQAGLAMTTDELAAVERNKHFQRVLWTERHRFWKEMAEDPERSKTAVIGQMMLLVQRLTEDGEYDKALEGLMKLAKVAGYVGPENQVNLFGGVSPSDLEEAKAKILERVSGGTVTQRPGSA